MAEKLTAAQRVALARDPGRPNVTDYINGLFTDFSGSGETVWLGRTPPFWAVWPGSTAAPSPSSAPRRERAWRKT